MKKIFFLMIVLCSTSAYARLDDKGFYTRFDTGRSFGIEKGIEKGEVFKSGFGQRVNDFLRFELSVNVFQNHLHGRTHEQWVTGKLNSRSVTGNIVLDLPVHEKVVPFIFGGYGWAINRLTQTVAGGTMFNRGRRHGQVWQAGAGIGIKIHPHFIIDLTYDYTNLGKFKMRPNTIKARSREARVQQGLIGVRCLFAEEN